MNLARLVLAAALLPAAIWGRAEAPQRLILMASTIGPIDAGIVSHLEEAFEQETGIRVRHVGAGTGAALDLARKGEVDLVMVHAKALEEKFVAEGFGTERIPLMFNDFVIVGPAEDPAGLRGQKKAAEALKKLAAACAPFLTRGDKSGTHVAELELWAQAGVKPAGPWYSVFERGAEGNLPTLLHADQKKAYTVIDRATYLEAKPRIALQVLVEGDEALLNHISLIPVNPAKCPKAHHAEALAFVAWLTHPQKGQKLIAAYGRDRFGAALFTPEAKSKP